MSIRSEIYTALSAVTGVGEVVKDWPEKFTTLPLVFYGIDERKPHPNFTYNQESRVVTKITVWSKTDPSGIAELITAKMATIGYYLVSEGDVSEMEATLHRIDMRFRALKGA